MYVYNVQCKLYSVQKHNIALFTMYNLHTWICTIVPPHQSHHIVCTLLGKVHCSVYPSKIGDDLIFISSILFLGTIESGGTKGPDLISGFGNLTQSNVPPLYS